MAGPYNIKLPDCFATSDLFVFDSASIGRLHSFSGTKINSNIEYWSQIHPNSEHARPGKKQPLTEKQSKMRKERQSILARLRYNKYKNIQTK